jgi:competence protein ComEC
VLKLKFRDRSILLTGDIEKKGEAALIGSDLTCDVVKVPHHGSKTSSTATFVSATNPRLAIISVGRDSMFGHPHAEVVERWKQSGAEVLTTGQSGMITVTTDGTDLWVKKFTER